MKTLLPFLKPYRGKCVFILLVTLADVAGALLIPTITADMINIAVEGSHMDLLLRKGILMLGIALLSGLLTLMGSWLCARLSLTSAAICARQSMTSPSRFPHRILKPSEQHP